MARVLVLLALTALAVLCVCSPVSALQFNVPANEEKCVEEETGSDGVMINGRYDTSPGYGQIIDLKVRDADGNTLYQRQNIADKADSFSISLPKAGMVSVCFENRVAPGTLVSPGLHRRVTLDLLVGSDAEADNRRATGVHLEPLAEELLNMESVVNSITEDLLYMRKREATHRDTNESTNMRVWIMSTVSISVLVGSSLWQIHYLRRYFAHKKML